MKSKAQHEKRQKLANATINTVRKQWNELAFNISGFAARVAIVGPAGGDG